MKAFLEKIEKYTQDVISCFDRIVLRGTWTDIGHADAMTRRLRRAGVRIFDYPQWAKQRTDEIREQTKRIAKENQIEIAFVRSHKKRKENLVAEIVKDRGDHPGLVCILSAMELCATYKPWHDKPTGRTFLKPDTSKCLHYYFYFIDEKLGLCYLRVPTWPPFRLQFYCNGHAILAHRLQQHGVDFQLIDNAFVKIEDTALAQKLSDALDIRKLHALIDQYVAQFCPSLSEFSSGVHWSIMQLEYATDILFRRREDLAPIYDVLVREAAVSVHADHIARFLGRKLDGRFRGEVGGNFSTRIEGTCLRHHMGKVSIKMYDKFGLILRVETTSNDVTFFKHHRMVEHRDGTKSFQLASVRKTIYSLTVMRKLLFAANCRYLRFLANFLDKAPGLRHLERVSQRKRQHGRTFRGFNFFLPDNLDLLFALARGEFSISGFTNAMLRRVLPQYTASQISRMLKRLRVHGLIKKIGKRYKYYLTNLGRRVVATALRLRSHIIIPGLASI